MGHPNIQSTCLLANHDLLPLFLHPLEHLVNTEHYYICISNTNLFSQESMHKTEHYYICLPTYLIRISPRLPVNCPSMYSSELANWKINKMMPLNNIRGTNEHNRLKQKFNHSIYIYLQVHV